MKKAALKLPRGTSVLPKKRKNIEKGKFGDRCALRSAQQLLSSLSVHRLTACPLQRGPRAHGQAGPVGSGAAQDEGIQEAAQYVARRCTF
jgi:hypothetical protein